MIPFKGDAEVTQPILGGPVATAPLSGVALPHNDPDPEDHGPYALVTSIRGRNARHCCARKN